MSATIEVNGIEATYNGEEWESDSLELLARIKAIPESPQHCGYDPTPFYTEAKYVAEFLGGNVVKVIWPKFVKGRIY